MALVFAARARFRRVLDGLGAVFGGRNASIFELSRLARACRANFVRTQQNTVKTGTRGTSELSRDKTTTTKNRYERRSSLRARSKRGRGRLRALFGSSRAANLASKTANMAAKTANLAAKTAQLAVRRPSRARFRATLARPRTTRSARRRPKPVFRQFPVVFGRFFIDFSSMNAPPDTLDAVRRSPIGQNIC